MIGAFFDWLLQALGIWERVASKVNTRDGWGISKNFYSILGLVVAESARVEELLGALCIALLELKLHTGGPLVVNLGYQSRIDVILSVVDLANRAKKINPDWSVEQAEAFQAKAAEIKRVIGLVQEAYPRRNLYAHAFYTKPSGDDDAHAYSVRIKGKVKIQDRVVTSDELYDVYLEIHDARFELARLVRELDVKMLFHDEEHLGDALLKTEAPPFRDPTSSTRLPQGLRPQTGKKTPRPKKLSSAQKRALRERGGAS